MMINFLLLQQPPIHQTNFFPYRIYNIKYYQAINLLHTHDHCFLKLILIHFVLTSMHPRTNGYHLFNKTIHQLSKKTCIYPFVAYQECNHTV